MKVILLIGGPFKVIWRNNWGTYIYWGSFVVIPEYGAGTCVGILWSILERICPVFIPCRPILV